MGKKVRGIASTERPRRQALRDALRGLLKPDEGSTAYRCLEPTAATLSPLLNAYTLRSGPPKTIVVPKVSALTGFRDLTVDGTLLKKQTIALDPASGERTVALGANGGAYRIEADGDLHFCLGTKQLEPHITCELQNAAAWLSTFQGAVGQAITVSGFFRCLFEHPGFEPRDDAHIFELHPVRAVSLAGELLAFNVDIPEQKSIHTWTSPHDLNQQDDRIRVTYDRGKDTLTFVGMDGLDENYVRVGGTVSKVNLSASGPAPATFTLTSPDIGRPIQGLCLQGTTAARELRQLKAAKVTLVALRNIDLTQALANRYVINLLAIDFQSA